MLPFPSISPNASIYRLQSSPCTLSDVIPWYKGEIACEGNLKLLTSRQNFLKSILTFIKLTVQFLILVS